MRAIAKGRYVFELIGSQLMRAVAAMRASEVASTKAANTGMDRCSLLLDGVGRIPDGGHLS